MTLVLAVGASPCRASSSRTLIEYSMKTLKIGSFGVFASLLLLVTVNGAKAQTTWLASPGTNDVNTGTNWSSGLPSSTVDAHFATSGTTNPSQSAAITIRD